MRTKSIVLALSVFTGAGLTLNAEKVRFEELPVDLQTKIRAHTGNASINDIDKQVKNGQTTYEVGFKQDQGLRRQQQVELRFNEQGQLLNKDGTPVQNPSKVAWNELPAAVKATASQRVTETSVNDIDRRMTDGQTTYEIGFKHNGAQQELLVSEDGRILRDVQLPAELLAGLRRQNTSPGQNTSLSPTPVNLSAKQKVEMSSLPQPAQTAITTAAGGARIEDVEVGTWNGRKVYEAAFKSGGQHVELQVAEDGRIVNDPRQTAAGAPAAGTAGTSKYADVKSPVQLSSSEKIDQNSVPQQVQQAFVAHTGGARPEDVDRGTWRNMPVYEIGFKQNGQHFELQLDQNGDVIYDPRKQSK